MARLRETPPLFVLLTALLCTVLCAVETSSDAMEMVPRKKLLILSSKGGGGHSSACTAVRQFVGEEYDIRVIHPIDQLRIWGVPACERVYNAMLQRGWIRSMNFIARYIAPHIFYAREEKIEKMITSYLKSFQPDLVISLIPFVNYPASEAARKMQKPYLLITTDNDLASWVLGLEKMKHPHFKVTISANLPSTRGLLLEKNIPESAIETIGYPLRAEFFEAKDKEYIKKEFGFTSSKPIVLVMMGGVGNEHAVQYAKAIGEMDLSIHIVVVAGKNARVKRAIEALSIHSSNELTVFTYTDRIADLMAVSDVLLTKPGPGTLTEAVSMQLPIFVDVMGSSLFWERVNIDLVKQFKVGYCIENYMHLPHVLKSYLYDPTHKLTMQEGFMSVPINVFHLRIKCLIDEMMQKAEECTALQVY